MTAKPWPPRRAPIYPSDGTDARALGGCVGRKLRAGRLVHLHRHTFEITKVGDKPTAGVMKETVNMTRFSTVEFDFVADDPGPWLLHCHHQDHQDEGFMGLVTYL